MRKVKPLNDFIFKKLFGEKGNEDILLYADRCSRNSLFRAS